MQCHYQGSMKCTAGLARARRNLVCLQVHVDGQAGAALSPFLAGCGGWLSTGLGNGFSTRRSPRQCRSPGRSPAGIWVPRLAEEQCCRSGSEATAPAPKLEHEGLEKQAEFVFGAVACRALAGVPPWTLLVYLGCITGWSVSPRCVCINLGISA